MRATGDIDICVRPSEENPERVLKALEAFGAPIVAHGISKADFAIPGAVYQIGLPPRRIDLLTEISGVSFEEAWQSRLEAEVQGIPVSFIGHAAMVKNKLASGRDKDLLDAKALSQRG